MIAGLKWEIQGQLKIVVNTLHKKMWKVSAKLPKTWIILTAVFLIVCFAVVKLPTAVFISEGSIAVTGIHTNKPNTVKKNTGDLPKISDKDNPESTNNYLSSDYKRGSQGTKYHKSILRKLNVHEDESTRKTNSSEVGQLQGFIGTKPDLHTVEKTHLKLKRKKQKYGDLIRGASYHRNIARYSISDEEMSNLKLALPKNKSKQLHKHFRNFLKVVG